MCRSTRDLARQGDAGATTRGDEEPDLPQKSGVSGQKGDTPARFPHALPGPSPSEESRDGTAPTSGRIAAGLRRDLAVGRRPTSAGPEWAMDHRPRCQEPISSP